MSDASIRVMTLLDDLEEILANASKVPFSEKAIVDSDEIRSIVDALISEAENHSRYIKLRSYEYVDKLLFDMQNDIAKVATEYIQPMNDYFTDMLGEMNGRVNGNRQEMKALAERIQGGASYSEGQQTAPEVEEEEQ